MTGRETRVQAKADCGGRGHARLGVGRHGVLDLYGHDFSSDRNPDLDARRRPSVKLRRFRHLLVDSFSKV